MNRLTVGEDNEGGTDKGVEGVILDRVSERGEVLKR